MRHRFPRQLPEPAGPPQAPPRGQPHRGGLENLAKLTNLEELSIGGNKIASLDELKPLEGLKLTAIDLEGCPCADGSDTYRQALFAMFPTLIFLDGTDVDGNERLIDDDDDEDDEDEDEEEDFDDDDDEDEDDFDEDEDDEDDDEDEIGRAHV